MTQTSLRAEPAMAPPQRISARGCYRLQLAARLLRQDRQLDELPPAQFHAHILRVIAALTELQRIRLKSAVDWVEAYEQQETAERSP